MLSDTLKEIESLVPSMGGWCTVEKAQSIFSLIIATRPMICLEIGTFYGRSAIPMAMAIKQIGIGHLTCIDPYNPTESARDENESNRVWWLHLDHNEVMNSFLSTVNSLGLQNVVKLERVTSDEYNPPDNIDILHVDGSHGPQAIKDMRRYGSRVRIGGYVIADDINWIAAERPTVREATQWLDEHGFTKLYEVTKPPTDPNQPGNDWGVWQRIS